MKFSKEEFESTLKSPDTEEHIDLYFYRRLGYFFACIGRSLHISPNAITIASIFIGVAAGICFYPTNIWVNVCGMLLLILADAFDSADGQLARMTKQYSRLGRILDGMAGDFWFIAIYVCICLRVNATSEFFMQASECLTATPGCSPSKSASMPAVPTECAAGVSAPSAPAHMMPATL